MDNKGIRADVKNINIEKKHTVYIENRKKINISGVINVDSFNDNDIILQTVLGMLVIKGTELHIIKLSLDVGDLLLEGNIDSFIYSEKYSIKQKGGNFLSKIFQ